MSFLIFCSLLKLNATHAEHVLYGHLVTVVFCGKKKKLKHLENIFIPTKKFFPFCYVTTSLIHDILLYIMLQFHANSLFDTWCDILSI